MFGSRHTRAAAVVASLLLGSAGAVRAATADLTLTAAKGDGTPVDGTNLLGAQNFILSVQYRITDLGGAGAHLELDICGTSSGRMQTPSGGNRDFGRDLPCLLPNGNHGFVFVGPHINGAGASTQAVTGLFAIVLSPQNINVPDGAVWTIPVRVVTDDPTPAVIGAGTIDIISHVHLAPQTAFDILHLATGTDPTTGARPGYRVTYRLRMMEQFYYDGSAPIPFADAAGTLPPGTELVSTAVYPTPNMPAEIFGPAYPAFSQTINVNKSCGPLLDGSGATVGFTFHNERILNLADKEDSCDVTVWYPRAASLVASLSAVATYSTGQVDHVEREIPLGDAPADGIKKHAQWGYDYVTQAAHVPTWADNLFFFSTPGALLAYLVESRAQTLANPWIIDRLPADVQALDVYSVTGVAGQPVDPALYAFSISTEDGCGPASTTTWIAADPHDPLALAPARCLRIQFTGLFQGATQIAYHARLRDQPRDYLLAQPDRYEVLDNIAWFGMDNAAGTNGTAWAGDPNVREYTDQSTVWNTNVARIGTQPTDWAFPHAGVGSSVQSKGWVPFDRLGGAGGTNFTDLTFRQTLPLELDLEGPPALDPAYLAPLDASGNPWLPTCEWHAQDQTQTPHVAAWWQCSFAGTYPALRADPFTAPGCNSGNDFCFDSPAGIYSPGRPVFNNFFFLIPQKILAGVQGQVIYQTMEAWSAVPLGPGGQAQPSSSLATAFSIGAADSRDANTITINGIQQMNMTNVAAGSQVAPGGTLAYDLRYSNSGTAGVSGTAIYDLFGRDPGSGAPLPGCEIPQLASVQSLGGLPAPIIEYTTDAPPVPNDTGSWSPTPPADLSLVTGVRIVPVSFFTGEAGVFGPTDPPGHVQLTLRDTAGVGAKMCNAAAITGKGFAAAQSTSAPADVVNSCGQITYGPGENEHGLVLFEDLWPHLGDADFNDQTVAYNYQFLSNSAGKVLALQLNVNVLSIGAGIRNGLWLHLPIPAAGAASITRTDQAGTHTALAAAADETDLVVELVSDTRSLFTANDPFINTVVTVPVRTPKAFQVKIVFAAPVELDTGASPHDLFLARSADRGHQIHLQEYAGTKTMDTSLFLSGEDRSSSAAHFIDGKGLPFALHVPAPIAWSRERVAIDLAYPAITDWALSGGTASMDWFSHPVSDQVYTTGAGILAPAPVMVGPALTDPSCSH